jgi:hypothetical protein
MSAMMTARSASPADLVKRYKVKELELNSSVSARYSTWPGYPLAAADDAGNRCGMVWVAVGRSGDELVGEVEASE